MSSFPNAPKLIKAGLVLVDPDTAKVQRIISLQYNANTLTRSLVSQEVGSDAHHTEPSRFKGPAVETFKFDADIDAIDQLEFPDQNAGATQFGIQPQLSLLESLVYPTAAQLRSVEQQANSGTLEIAPMLAPLVLFVWGKNRIVPVKVTEFSISEEAFDPSLNPIRAKVGLGLRTLSVDDLGFNSRGGSLFMTYLQNKERLASGAAPASLSTLGIGGIG
ncbi:hypothetical protein QTI66_08695 [Variovorax sp. J22R133]|uniref:hypothetical protein n=1 Tax=Variovorax brevis TaxID=3053503 RepID=UPI002576AD48|nr:hypothetical protein [Variovorax sp. J22R133]MDM0112226.1 hypothetical protein [Variovorax sp. J22R133]